MHAGEGCAIHAESAVGCCKSRGKSKECLPSGQSFSTAFSTRWGKEHVILRSLDALISPLARAPSSSPSLQLSSSSLFLVDLDLQCRGRPDDFCFVESESPVGPFCFSECEYFDFE